MVEKTEAQKGRDLCGVLLQVSWQNHGENLGVVAAVSFPGQPVLTVDCYFPGTLDNQLVMCVLKVMLLIDFVVVMLSSLFFSVHHLIYSFRSFGLVSKLLHKFED